MTYRPLIFFALMMIGLTACKTTDILSYQYESTTMMGKTIYLITADSVVMTFTGRGEPKKETWNVTSSQWTALGEALEEVALKSIGELEAPSDLRSTDASPFAKLTVTTKDGTSYTTKTFDGFTPHETLQPLLDQIKKIVKKSE